MWSTQCKKIPAQFLPGPESFSSTQRTATSAERWRKKGVTPTDQCFTIDDMKAPLLTFGTVPNRGEPQQWPGCQGGSERLSGAGDSSVFNDSISLRLSPALSTTKQAALDGHKNYVHGQLQGYHSGRHSKSPADIMMERAAVHALQTLFNIHTNLSKGDTLNDADKSSYRRH
jgi:hypothetical protein